MMHGSRLERGCYPFSHSSQNLPQRDNNIEERENFEDEDFVNKSTIRTLHHPHGCMHCRVYSRHIDESPPDLSPFNESPSFSEDVPHLTYEDGIRLGRRLQEGDDYYLLSRYQAQLHRLHEQHENSLLAKARYRHELECTKEEVELLKDELLAIQIAYDEVTSIGRSSPRQQGSSSNHWLDRAEAGTWGDHEQDDGSFANAQPIHVEEKKRRQDTGVWTDLDAHSNTSESTSCDLSLSSGSSISSLSDDAQPSRSHQGEEAEELTIEYVSSLMAAAHTRRDTEALDEVRLLINDAHRTHKSKRTAAQLHLLLKWRIPSSSSIRVPSTPPSSSVKVPSTPPSSSVRVPSTPSTSSINFISGPTTNPSPASPEIFVDASGFGIGFIFNEHWLAWSFVQGHPDIPMGPDDHVVMSWAELTAAEMGILALVSAGYRNTRVILWADNEGVVTALKKRTWTKNFGLDEILKRVLKICKDYNLDVIPRWISTKANPADKPSRGVYPPKNLMFSHNPAIPSHLQSVLKVAGA